MIIVFHDKNPDNKKSILFVLKILIINYNSFHKETRIYYKFHYLHKQKSNNVFSLVLYLILTNDFNFAMFQFLNILKNILNCLLSHIFNRHYHNLFNLLSFKTKCLNMFRFSPLLRIVTSRNITINIFDYFYQRGYLFNQICYKVCLYMALHPHCLINYHQIW